MKADYTLGGRIAPPSFQSLFLRMKFGDTQLASGTGFLVKTNAGLGLVTARHNFTGRHHDTSDCLSRHGGIPDTVEIFHNGMTPGTNVIRAESLLSEGGKPRWLEHPEMGNQCDVALLPLRNVSDIMAAPYSFQTNYPDIAIAVAEPVSVIGFPMSKSAGAMLAIWCTGYIASEPTLDYDGQPKFLIDCRTRQGQSGSPVIAYRNGAFNAPGGKIMFGSTTAMRPLGIYTGRIHSDADIGVVWKWAIIEDLIRNAGIAFSPIRTTIRFEVAGKPFDQDSAFFKFNR